MFLEYAVSMTTDRGNWGAAIRPFPPLAPRELGSIRCEADLHLHGNGRLGKLQNRLPWLHDLSDRENLLKRRERRTRLTEINRR